MTTNEVPTTLPTGSPAEPSDEPLVDPTGQLLLLPDVTESLRESHEHARFRLSRETRERGLRHVAEIRARLAATSTRDRADNVVRLPPRRKPAA